MPLQDKGVNENEDIEKSVIISGTAGAEVYKFAIRLVYEGRELSRWNRRAVFTGMLALFSY